MRPSAQPFLWKWVLFAWEWKIILISKAEHLTSFWYRGSGELGNGLFVNTYQTSSRRGWPRGFGALNAMLPNIYFRLSGSYSFNSAEQVFTLHRSVAQHLSDMWLSTIEIGSAQLRFVTEIAPLEPFLCVNRSSFWYDFRGGEKATWYSVNTTLMTTCIYNALFFTVL